MNAFVDNVLTFVEGTGIKVLRDGFQVARRCDFIIYSVEAESIHNVYS